MVGIVGLLLLVYLLLVVQTTLVLLPVLFVEFQVAVVALLWYVLRELSARNAAEEVPPLSHD